MNKVDRVDEVDRNLEPDVPIPLILFILSKISFGSFSGFSRLSPASFHLGSFRIFSNRSFCKSLQTRNLFFTFGFVS